MTIRCNKKYDLNIRIRFKASALKAQIKPVRSQVVQRGGKKPGTYNFYLAERAFSGSSMTPLRGQEHFLKSIL